MCTPAAVVVPFLLRTASDGRLYRCDVNSGLSNGTLSRITASTTKDDVSDDWQEQEASRLHSVKFTDPQDQENKEVSLFIDSSHTILLLKNRCVLEMGNSVNFYKLRCAIGLVRRPGTLAQ